MKTEEELKILYKSALDGIEVGALYSHYKHPGEKAYRVICVGLKEDDWTPMVTYEHVKSEVRFVRTKENFVGKVKVNGQEVPRFTIAS